MTQFERYENDEIGLAAWVDEQILAQEEHETEMRLKGAPAKEVRKGDEPEPKREEEKPAGPFKISLVPRGRPRGTVTAFVKPESKDEAATGTEPPAAAKVK